MVLYRSLPFLSMGTEKVRKDLTNVNLMMLTVTSNENKMQCSSLKIKDADCMGLYCKC